MPSHDAGPAEQQNGLRVISYRVRTRSSRWTPAAGGRSKPAATSPPSRPLWNACIWSPDPPTRPGPAEHGGPCAEASPERFRHHL